MTVTVDDDAADNATGISTESASVIDADTGCVNTAGLTDDACLATNSVRICVVVAGSGSVIVAVRRTVYAPALPDSGVPENSRVFGSNAIPGGSVPATESSCALASTANVPLTPTVKAA